MKNNITAPRSCLSFWNGEVDKDHGRLETCRYWITEELRTLPNTEPCRGLRSIGLADARRFAHAVRGHWRVENRLHWRLDVVFREDTSPIRKGNAPAIMTAIRHLCMNLWEREPSS